MYRVNPKYIGAKTFLKDGSLVILSEDSQTTIRTDGKKFVFRAATQKDLKEIHERGSKDRQGKLLVEKIEDGNPSAEQLRGHGSGLQSKDIKNKVRKKAAGNPKRKPDTGANSG